MWRSAGGGGMLKQAKRGRWRERHPKERMTAEEFIAWEEGVPGRYELVDGQIFAQAAERAAHAKIKGEVFVALREAIRRDGLPCQALPDGRAVRIDKGTVFEPDAQVYCGPELPSDALLSENPIIVVEVISPSTGVTMRCASSKAISDCRACATI